MWAYCSSEPMGEQGESSRARNGLWAQKHKCISQEQRANTRVAQPGSLCLALHHQPIPASSLTGQEPPFCTVPDPPKSNTTLFFTNIPPSYFVWISKAFLWYSTSSLIPALQGESCYAEGELPKNTQVVLMNWISSLWEQDSHEHYQGHGAVIQDVLCWA